MVTLGRITATLPRACKVVQPEPMAVRPYVGLSALSGQLYAFEYLGGTYVGLLAQKSLTGTGLTASSTAPWAILSTSPLILAWQRSNKVLVWNVTANTLAGPTSLVLGTSEIAGGGRDGFAYFVEFGPPDYFPLWKVATNAAVTQVTAVGQETLAAPLTGSPLNSLFWNGTNGAIAVGNDPGGAGYVVVSAAQPVFTADADWLPGDPASDWGWWNNTSVSRVPGQSFAAGVWETADSYLVKVPNPPSGATVLLESADMGGESPFECDPSPDGVSALLRSLTKIAQVSLTAPQPPVWLTIDQAPAVSDTPDAFFCLD